MTNILGWRIARHSNVCLLLAVILAGLQAGNPEARAQTAEPPNLIFILTDDLSDDLLKALLGTGFAPNIKRYLAEEGIAFENAFVTNALCCPSRATFLTGQYTHNHKVLANRAGLCRSKRHGIEWPGWFPQEGSPGRNASTVATWLRAAGYTTGHIGRYLNGYGLTAPDGEPDPKLYIPPGWDDWQGLVDPTTFQVYDYELNDNGTLVTYGGGETDYQTDVLAQRAARFIDDRAAGEERFFLSIATFAPHLEVTEAQVDTCGANTDLLDLRIRPAPRHAHLIDNDITNGELPLPVIAPSFNEADLSDKPSCPPDGSPNTFDPRCTGDLPLLRSGVDIPRFVDLYKSMMASMIAVDDLVGTVMDALVANGLDGQTVVIFTSDNGWVYGEHRMIGKQVAYEESIRVPLLVRAPGFAVGAGAPQIVLNNDLAATLAELAGATPTHDVDGTSLVPLLEDPGRTDWHRKGFLVEHWFVPETGFATYFALRYLNAANNFLYTTTYADFEAPNVITHREFYEMNGDPNQLESLELTASQLAGITDYLLRFRLCAGASCRSLEGLQLP